MQYKNITLNRIKDLDIFDIISRFFDLKKQGANYIACCPFHDEKTPSFVVSPNKQLYYCFGCEAKGDGINFVMEYEKLTFFEAIERIANLFSIPIEYEHYSDEELQAYQQQQLEKKEIHDALVYARDFFEKHSPQEYLLNRKLSEDTITTFQLGFAPKGNSFFKELEKKGKDLSSFEKAGLIKKGEKGYYDVFQNRVIIPIQNRSGALVAFTARNVQENSPYPKYFNSSDKVYNKSEHFFGLNHAFKFIQKEDFVYLVEGNFDVIQLHNKGLKNAIAQGGTTLSHSQLNLLKQVTNKVCIVPDNDEAGLNALFKNVNQLLNNGFYVYVLFPEKKDADEDLRSGVDIEKWKERKEDFITDFLLKECIKNGKKSPIDLIEQIQKLGETLELVQDSVLRNTYYDICKKSWKEFGKNYKLKPSKKQVKETKQEKNYGFIEKNGCYVVLQKEGEEIPISNFTMEPLFFINHKEEPKYYVKLRHQKGREAFTVISTDDFTAVQTFVKAVERKGHFFFTGTNSQLYKLKEKLLFGVSVANEQQILGKNRDYYIWANGIIYNEQFFKADRHGIVKINKPILFLEDFQSLAGGVQVKIKEKEITLNSAFDIIVEYGEEELISLIDQREVSYLDYVFIAASSKTILSGDEQDNYSEVRKFSHNEKSTLDFNKWSNLMLKSYVKGNGMVGISFYVMSLFRDIIFTENNNWNPLLFCFGLPQKGKSKFAESLASMFGKPMEDGINLEGGSTTTGIRRFMASRTNAIVWLNEYKNDLSIQTIGMLKSLADGSGKLQGQKTAGIETNHYKPRSSAIVCGQDLPTKDPALLSRCILNEFDGVFGDYDAYEELKDYEHNQSTTNVTCELLKYHQLIKQNYKITSKYVLQDLKRHCKQQFLKFEDRTFLNMVSLISPIIILIQETDLQFPFTYEELVNQLFDRVKMQEKIRRTADEVEQFFTTLAAMVGREIMENEHFKITKDKETGDEKLLLRLRKVHPFYLEKSKRQGITTYHLGVIKNYLEKHESYIGIVKSKFGMVSTTALCFDYEYLKQNEIEFY